MPVTPGATIEPGVSTGAQHSNAPQSKAAVNEETSVVVKNHSNTHVSVCEGHNDGTIKAYTHSIINKSKSIHYHDTREADVISPESLIAMIKQRYRENDRLSDMFAGDGPSLTLSEGCYINLALVKSVEQKAKEKDQCKKGAQPKAIDTYLERQPLSSFEEIYQPKEALPLAELFVPKASEGSHPIHRVLMLGRAGIGKSTLCHYLANRWATGNGVDAEEAWLQDYAVVLWGRLRELIKFRDDCKEPAQCDVTHFFVHQCLTNTHGFEERSIRAMEQLLADRRKKKLLLLDGFDEVAHLYRDSSDINLQRLLHTLVPETTPSVSKDSNYHVLLTSRPYAVSGLRAEREVENIGLSDENIDAYVKQYFSKLNHAHDQAATRLIEQLRVNPNLRGMSHIPVNLYLLCFQHQKAMEYEDQGEHRLRLQSLTQLYQQLVSDLCQRNSRQRAYEGRIAGLIKDYQLPLQALAELAFEGLKGKGLMLSWPLQEQVFHKHHVISSYEQEVLSLGLMKTIGGITQSQSKAPRYFIHLTFQEFFAALHLVWGLADHSAEENNTEVTQLQKFIQRHKYTPRYQVVFWFAAGLIRDVTWFQNNTTLQQRVFHAFWHEGLLAKPLDLTGFGHIPLLTRAFEEGGFFDEEDEVSMDEALQAMARVHQVRCAELLLSDRESALAQRLIPTIQGCPRLKAFVARQLAVALNDEGVVVRWSAVEVLGAIKPQETSVHQALVVALKDEDAGVRHRVADALCAIKPQETSVHQALVGLLNDEDADVRYHAANALSAIKPQDSAVHQALVEALNDEDKDVRHRVADALCAIKPQETSVHQALVGLLNDEDAAVRWRAVDVLGAIKPQETSVHQALVDLLNDEDWVVRSRVADALVAIKPQDRAVHQALVEALNDEDKDVRCNAVDALGAIKPQETSVHQALVGALNDEDAGVRWRVVDALCAIKPQDRAVHQALVEALKDEDWAVRRRAAYALCAIKPQERLVHQALVGLLKDEDKEVRSSAAKALGTIKPQDRAVHQALVGLLNDKNAGVRRSAVKALGAIKPQETSVHQALVGLLKDENAGVRFRAVKALGAIKPQETSVHQALVGLLKDEDAAVRFSAADALGAIKPQETSVHQALVGLLNDKNAGVRFSAAKALGAIKPQETSVHQTLVGLLKDEDAGVRWRAADALGAIKPQETSVHQALVGLLNDEDAAVRYHAADALVAIKPQDRAVHQALVAALNDEDKEVRRRVADALCAIKPQDSAMHQALVEALKNEDKDVRRSVANALGAIKPQDRAVHQALAEALKDEDAGVRSRVANALGAIKPQDRAVHQALAEALKDEDAGVRSRVAEALDAIKPQDRAVHQALVGLLNDGNAGVRSRAADALGAIKPQETSVHQALVGLLNDEDAAVRYHAADALGAIKPQDSAVHQALAEALNDEDKYVRSSVAYALGAIKPQEMSVYQALVDLLNDEDASVRFSAAYALGAIKPQEISVYQALVGLLNDEDAGVRLSAAKALGAIKPQEMSVYQALVDLLNDKDWAVRSSAAKALGAIKPQEISVYQALVGLLNDEDAGVRFSAAKALGAIKPQDRAVHQALVGLLNDEDVFVRHRAAEALKEIIDSVQLDTLLPLLHSHLHENKRVWLTPSAYSRWLRQFFNPKTQNESQKYTAKLVWLSQLLARFAVDDLQLAITIQGNTMLLCSSRIDLAIKVSANAYSQAALTAFKAALNCEQLFMIFNSIEPQTQSSYDEPIKGQLWQLGLVRKVWSLLQQYRNNNQTGLVYYLGGKFTEKLINDITLSTVPLCLKIGLISLQAGSQLNERISEEFIGYLFLLCLIYLVRGDFQRLPSLSTSILELNKVDLDDEQSIMFSRFLARVYQASGQSVLARQWFDKAVSQVDVSKAELVLDFAHHCIIQEQPKKALSLLATVLSQLSSDEPNQANPNDIDEEILDSESESDDELPEFFYSYQELAQCGDKGLQSYSQAKLSTRLLKPKQKREKFDEDYFKQPMLKLDASQQLTLAYYFKAKAHHMLNQTKECEEALQAFNTSQAATTVTEKQALHTYLSKALTEFIHQPFVPTSSLKKETVTLPKATAVPPFTKNTRSMLTHPGYRMILVGLLLGSFMVTSTLLLVIVLLSCFQSALLSQLLLSLHLTYPLLLLAPACLLGAVFGSVMGWLLSEKSILAYTNNTQLSPATIVLAYMLSGGLLLALVTAAVLTLVSVITSFWVAPPILWLMMSLAPSVGLMLGYLVGCYQVQQGPLSKTHITYLVTTFSASLGAVLGIILSGAMTVGFGIVGGGVVLGLPILAMYLIPTITILTTAVGYYLTQRIITKDTVQMRESVLNPMQISAPQPGSGEFDACAVSYLRVQETMNDATAYLPSASELTQTTELNPVVSVVLS